MEIIFNCGLDLLKIHSKPVEHCGVNFISMFCFNKYIYMYPGIFTAIQGTA